MIEEKKSPFKLLDSFSKEDNNLFFGRENEIEELYRKVFDSKILLIYGVSGTGKSSIINCGLANKFLESDWLPINVRRGQDINNSLLNELKNCISSDSPKKNDSAIELVRSVYLDNYKPVYLIFDQFEEIFIYGSTKEQRCFIENIKQIKDTDLSCKIIISLREEYLANLTDFEEVVPDIFLNRIRLTQITKLKAKDIIEKQCKELNIKLENGFSEFLLDILCSGKNHLELTYLQVYLDKIYQFASHQDSTQSIIFSKEIINSIGRINDILGSFVEEQIKQLSNPEKGLTILKSFISIYGTKKALNIDEVINYLKDFKNDYSKIDVREIVQSLVNLRILKDKDEYDKYEIRHDSIAEKIYQQITINEKDLFEVRQFIKDQFNHYKKRGYLLSASDLEYIQPFLNRLYFNYQVNDFIKLSKNELVKHKRRKRLFLIFSSAILFVILTSFTIWALIERNKSNLFAMASRSNELSALSMLNLQNDPTLSYFYAKEAFDIKHSTSSLEALTSVIDNFSYNPSYTELNGHDDAIYLTKYLKRRELILTASLDSTVKIWNENGCLLATFNGHKSSGRIFGLDVSSNEEKIITSDESGMTFLWEYNDSTNLQYKKVKSIIIRDTLLNSRYTQITSNGKFLISVGLNNSVYTRKYSDSKSKWLIDKKYTGHSDLILNLEISSNDKYFATVSVDNTGRIWDFEGNCISVLRGHNGVVRHIDFSPDNRHVITSSDDGTARLWNIFGRCLKVFRDHSGRVTRSIFSPDNSYIVTVSDDNWAYVYDNYLALKFGVESSEIKRVDVSSDSKYIALGNDNGSASVWGRDGSFYFNLKGHNESIYDMHFMQNDSKIITGSADKTAKVWNLKDTSLTIIDRKINKFLNYNPKNKDEVLIIDSENNLAIYNVRFDLIETRFNYAQSNIIAEYSNNGKFILTSSEEKVVRLWNKLGREIETFPHPKTINSVAFSHDDRYIVASCEDGCIYIWDLLTGSNKLFCFGNLPIRDAEFSMDSKNIVLVTGKKTIIWSIIDSTLFELPDQEYSVANAFYSSDGNYLYTSLSDGSVIQWTSSGLKLRHFVKHPSVVNTILFSDNGNYILTYSEKPDIIRLLDLDGNLLNSIKLTENNQYLNFVDFKTDSIINVYTLTGDRIYFRQWPVNSQNLLKLRWCINE